MAIGIILASFIAPNNRGSSLGFVESPNFVRVLDMKIVKFGKIKVSMLVIRIGNLGYL